eukprot:sb/3475590/
MVSNDPNVNFTDYGSSIVPGGVPGSVPGGVPGGVSPVGPIGPVGPVGGGGQQSKSPVKVSPSPESLLSTVQCLPQRYREIMMRSSQPEELKISRHPNTETQQQRLLFGQQPGGGSPNHKVERTYV